jgi:hypothetical protein
VPANTEFWAVTAFIGPNLVKVEFSLGNERAVLQGRAKGARFRDCVLSSSTERSQPLTLRATTIGDKRELVAAMVRRWDDNLIVGFGQRSKPVEVTHREGAYPHDVVVLGFLSVNH